MELDPLGGSSFARSETSDMSSEISECLAEQNDNRT